MLYVYPVVKHCPLLEHHHNKDPHRCHRHLHQGPRQPQGCLLLLRSQTYLEWVVVAFPRLFHNNISHPRCHHHRHPCLLHGLGEIIILVLAIIIVTTYRYLPQQQQIGLQIHHLLHLQRLLNPSKYRYRI
eukprot:PhF_6_TR4889/c0_g1_i1/m.6901